MTLWSEDTGLTDVTAAFKGFSQPLHELVDDIHRRGWTVTKIHIKDGEYLAEGKNPHQEKLVATGRTDATAAANLLVKIMRREFMRGSSVKAKLGAWDHQPIEAQLPAIAQGYAGAPVYEPKAAPAWMDLAQDCGRRSLTIRQQLAVEYTDDPVPYESADEMREDVTKKRHIIVTRAYAHHPVWSEQQMLDYRLVVDVLGHAIGGGDWGWHGTCLAFAALAPLLAESPQKALFTELLGQAAFGVFYRQWGPQKICFLEDLIAKEQEKENKPGHTGVHPSQSIVPMAMPGVFSRTAMAERSGDPALDAAIYEFMSRHRGELGDIQDYRHPEVAWGQCELVAEECAQFLEARGFKAYKTDTDLDELGYQDAQKSEDVGAGDFTYPEHSVVSIYNEHGIVWWTIDFTAAQYGYAEFPKVEPGPVGPLVGPQQQQTLSAIVGTPTDPNANWESGVQPLQDNAYLWQRDENGVDPLNAQSVTDSLHPLETGISRMHPQMLTQAVVNALRSSLLGTRSNPMGHAIHYQDLMHIPSGVDDPVAYWDTLEQQREHWNQAKGYAPGSHKQYWPQEQQFKQWVKAANPHLDDGDVGRLAKREMMHMLMEEEERVIAQDQGEQLTAEVVQHEAYEGLKRRLKALTKPNVDQKVDFGEDHLWHEASGDGLINYYDLPHGFAQDEDLERQLDAMYGAHPSQYNFRLQQIPMSALDAESHTLANYENSVDELDDGPRRVQIIRDEIARLQAGGEPIPFVVDRSASDPSKYWLRDGYHRAAAARTLGLTHHPAYVMQDDEDEAQHQSKTATHHADMYPPYLISRLRPMAQVSRNATALAEAAREDLVSHKGHGHHFRSTALSLGIPHLGPRQVSHAWLHLAPQTSQLGVIEPHVMETLGHDYQTDHSNRDYFKHERELASGRDASGYGHVPLGAFSTGLYDLSVGGPGWHPDRTAFKVHSPAPHHAINWAAQNPTYPSWTDPYWWQSTQQARDQAATEFDRNVGVNFRRDEIPFQKMAAHEPHIHFHDELDPTNMLGNAQGYWGRWPTVYDLATDTVHVGPEGSTHYQIKDVLGIDDKDGQLSHGYAPVPEGWIGQNPELDSGLSPVERQIGPTTIGWYNGSPGPHIDYALATRQWPRHPDSDAEDPNQGYGHAPRLTSSEEPGWSQPGDPDYIEGHDGNWGGPGENYNPNAQPPGEKPIYIEMPYRNAFTGEQATYRGPIMKILPFEKRGEQFHSLVINPMTTLTARPGDYTIIPTDDLQQAPEVAPDQPEHFARTAMQWDDAGNLSPVYDLKPGERAYPWVTHPTTGERVSGAPGTSLMQHVMTTMGHQDPREVWAQDYEVGKS